MSTELLFTKDNLITYFKELGKAFRKLNGTKMSAEIILIGGAAILAHYSFRETTYDIDAVILASSVLKQAVNQVGDKFGLPNGWLNTDFRNTSSYSDRLSEVSTYYRTFSNVITVRIVAGEYLIAMKLVSGRQYKNDLSDIAGVLWEHQKAGTPITRESVDKAIITLYGEEAVLPNISLKLIDDIFAESDYERAYNEIRENEKHARDVLLEFDRTYPGELKGESIDDILARAKQKRQNDK